MHAALTLCQKCLLLTYLLLYDTEFTCVQLFINKCYHRYVHFLLVIPFWIWWFQIKFTWNFSFSFSHSLFFFLEEFRGKKKYTYHWFHISFVNSFECYIICSHTISCFYMLEIYAYTLHVLAMTKKNLCSSNNRTCLRFNFNLFVIKVIRETENKNVHFKFDWVNLICNS